MPRPAPVPTWPNELEAGARLRPLAPYEIGPGDDIVAKITEGLAGRLFRALGQGDDACKAFAASLAIRQRLATNEPDRADYQRDLSVSHDRMGDLFRVLGQGDDARKAYATSLAIRERPAANEPGRADYQRAHAVEATLAAASPAAGARAASAPSPGETRGRSAPGR